MLTDLSSCDYTPKKELENRIGRLKEGMAEKGIDYAIVLQNVDLFYFTGSLQKSYLVVPVEGDPLFLVEKNIERATAESPLDQISVARDKDVRGIILEKGIRGKAGMELDVLPVTMFRRWKTILDIEDAEDVSGIIRDLRSVKSEYEISQLKKSGEICEHVFAFAEGFIKEGMRELDIDAALNAEGRRKGHQGFLRMRGLNQEMMNIYVTHGRSGAIVSGADVPISGTGITHAISQGSSFNQIMPGVPVVVDYGGGYNGYITDETRAYVAGEMKEPFLRGYQAAREIIEETGRGGWAKAGTNAAELFNRALKIAKREGLAEHFMGYGRSRVGFIGHGLGLEINELPVITPRHEIPLKEGMVFAFEPKFIFPGEGSIGIEVDYIVRKDSLERITGTPIDIVYV
ncbi:MAG: aminopeptidase P family protein [Deltaproteobacteria bacterium]|nr:aminopeptidase P family protein [Deltaproteobacteria bacterium]